jgi:hypothetical protein
MEWRHHRQTCLGAGRLGNGASCEETAQLPGGAVGLRDSLLLLGWASLGAAGACTDAPKLTEAKSPPPILAAVTGVHVQAIVGQRVTPDPTVRLTDAAGHPMSGANILFIDDESQSLAVTASDGLASGTWRLTQRAGTQTLTARVYNPVTMTRPVDVTFTAVAVPDTLAAIYPLSDYVLAGAPSQPLISPPVVVAVDEYANGKPGVTVTFEVLGGGSVAPQSAVTDADGRAAVTSWRLGTDFGIDTLIARVGTLPPVYFTAQVVQPFRALAVVSGNETTCAIALGGEVYCWGTNRLGQVNPGDPTLFFIFPQRVPLPAKAVSISGGYNHTCAVTAEVPPQAYCWGDNSTGQLGSADRTLPASTVPRKVLVAEGLASVTTGYDHSCGLTPGGVAYCWGSGAFGQLGAGDITGCYVTIYGVATGCPGPRPVADSTRFATLAAGVSHTCGIGASGQLYCWGLNDAGQLGFQSPSACSQDDYYGPYLIPCSLAPRQVSGTPAFAAVAAGGATCALGASGIMCFGPPFGTERVPSLVTYTSLTPDGACAVGSDDSAYCWLTNFDAQGAYFDHPVAVSHGLSIAAITSAQSHRCAIVKSDSTVVCWGSNDSGELGNGSTVFGAAPTPVLSPPRP